MLLFPLKLVRFSVSVTKWILTNKTWSSSFIILQLPSIIFKGRSQKSSLYWRQIKQHQKVTIWIKFAVTLFISWPKSTASSTCRDENYIVTVLNCQEEGHFYVCPRELHVHPRPVRPCQKPGTLICKHLCLKHHQRTHQTLFIPKPNHPGSRPDSWSLRNVQFTPVVCCLKENIQDGFFTVPPLKWLSASPLRKPRTVPPKKTTKKEKS